MCTRLNTSNKYFFLKVLKYSIVIPWARVLFEVLLPFPMSPNHKIAQKFKVSKIRHYILATSVECFMHNVGVKSKQRVSPEYARHSSNPT